MAKILVIDDDDSIRELLRVILESRGHQVVEAKDGSLGITMVQNDGFDLVVTDMVMPKFGGMDTIMELYRIMPALPVIAISGRIPPDVRPITDLIHQFGVRDILQKPFSNQIFVEAVDAALAVN